MIYCKFLLHEEKMLFIERQLKVEIEDGCKAPKKTSIGKNEKTFLLIKLIKVLIFTHKLHISTMFYSITLYCYSIQHAICTHFTY